VLKYFEIPVLDLDRAVQFYSQCFNCEFERGSVHDNEMAFFIFDPKISAVPGALAKGKTYLPSLSGTLIYLSTNDVSLSLSKVTQAGGLELFPRTEVPGYGWVAEFQDCEGNRVGLFQGV
jgi:uncharacterized protein